MYPSQLKIDTKVRATSSQPSGSVGSLRPRRNLTPSSATSMAGPSTITQRLRSTSNASTTSTLSIVSPNTASTNASTSSLQLPTDPGRSRVVTSRKSSPIRADFERPTHVVKDNALAMHDYAPRHPDTTYLSFRAGQLIHVLTRDPSGWWDGELEGRRGWFPSNYVTEVNSLTREEPPKSPYRGHKQSISTDSTASWASVASSRHQRRSSLSQEIDSYCPPLMVPLLHGLSLLQTAVRTNRISHFQPSTACIISCVRTILSSTETLLRDAPILQQYPILAQERRRILSVLASLVAQAKKASEEVPEDQSLDIELEMENMLRLSGQVFAHVRRFLAVAVQCGVQLPDQRGSMSSASGSTDTGRQSWGDQSQGFGFPTVSYGSDSPDGRTPKNNRMRGQEIMATPGSTLRAKSMGDLRSRALASFILNDEDSDSAAPLLPHRTPVGKSKQEQYLPRSRSLTRRRQQEQQGFTSISSISSSSSFSSQESVAGPLTPLPFPCGPSSTARVMEALRNTHDHYLSTIAAFIGHAHSHSRTSHASSTGHLYDLVREIVEMVCKLLTIVDAVMLHPDVPSMRLGNLKAAKEGLYNVTSSLAESVRLLTLTLPSSMSDEEEKQTLLRSAMGSLKAGADCVAAVKVCLNRNVGEKPFIIHLPKIESGPDAFTPSKFARPLPRKVSTLSALSGYPYDGVDDEDLTIQAQTPSPVRRTTGLSSSSGSNGSSSVSKSSSRQSEETNITMPEEDKPLPPIVIPTTPSEPDMPSPTSLAKTDEDGTTWEGSQRSHESHKALEEKIFNGSLPAVPLNPIPEFVQDPVAWLISHDYSLEDVAYNTEGHLVGATIDVLVEKMTPHDSLVDPAFSAVFFLTFRLFSTPAELVEVIIARYNLLPPSGISREDLQLWQQRKGIPVRLRVSNFIKIWVEMYWRPIVDDLALQPLTDFTRDGLAALFPGPAQRILELLEMRRRSTDVAAISPKADRSRDPGMSINPPTLASLVPSEIPRPTMTKTLLAALRSKNFASIVVTDFDALELARQLTIMECSLYSAIQPEEILETGQPGAKLPVNVRAVSSLSTVITGWVAESILNEPDIKKRTMLIKFFIKVADRCTSLHNYSTGRSMLAALDSSTISRLHQTWSGLPQKYKLQLESLRRLADHSRNYHEYRSKLRNTAPPAVPFLGLYLTDVTFCREGNPSHRASPINPSKKLLNFNKYHKLARIVQDMQRFQVPYNLKAIPEVQQYLNIAFENSKHHGDLQDLYRRSLLVEPKQHVDAPPPTSATDMRQLFNWATRSQNQPAAAASSS